MLNLLAIITNKWVSLSLRDKSTHSTHQFSTKVRLMSTAHWAVRVQFLVEGHLSVLMETILQYPPGSSSQATIRLDWWMCFKHQLDAERDWFSPDIASWHTCAWIRLIGWHSWRDSQRKRGRKTSWSIPIRWEDLFSAHYKQPLNNCSGPCVLKITEVAMWYTSKKILFNTMYCFVK